MTVPLLTMKKVSKHYPISGGVFKRRVGTVRVLNGIDLNLAKGRITGLVGESGCGKSTLAKLLVKLEEPSEGEIHFENQPIADFKGSKRREYHRQVQMVFQDPFSSLNPRMTVKRIIGEMVRIQGGSKTEALEQTRSMLQQVGLSDDALNRYPHAFSGGQRQRIAIARALVVRPKLLIADEPVSALDLSLQAKTLELLQGLKSTFDLTILLISHDLRKVARFCQSVAVMYLGRIVEILPGERLLTDYRHPYTEALIGSIPIMHPAKRQSEKKAIKGEVPSPIDLPTGCAFHKRCPRRLPHCHEKVPELKATGSEGHYLACYLRNKK